MIDDDDFGGFEEAQPVNSSQELSNNKNDNYQTSPGSAYNNNEQKTPEWLVESFKNSFKLSPSATTNTTISHNDQQSNQSEMRIKILEEKLSKTFEYIKIQDRKFEQLQLDQKQQLEALYLNNLKRQEQIKGEFDLNLKKLQAQVESYEKSSELKQSMHMEHLEKTLIKHFEEKFERKLASNQEQLIKHYESSYEDLEMKLKKFSKTFIDEQLTLKLTKSLELLMIEHKNESERFLKQFFHSQSELFKDQMKSSIEQETLVLKDTLNNKVEKLLRNYELKERNSNHLYLRQLNNLTQFLDHAKSQIGLMQNHIQKQNECLINPNNSNIIDSIESAKPIEDDQLLNV